MDKRTIVLPSARAIREQLLSLESNTLFLANYVTMNEFVSKLCIVEQKTYIDDDTRVLLLLEASNFHEFAALQIERNFFTFTKNSNYIFKFFSELSAEMYSIENLKDADVYAEYEEHITILTELYRRYEQLCQERSYLDPIFIPSYYTFNTHYALSHKHIEIKVDGHLTNFELQLLQEATQYTQVDILFTTSRFNTKMQKKFQDLGIETEVGYLYRISLNTKEILSQSIITTNHNVSCESFSEPLLQVAFVKNKIYEFIKKGHRAEKIAVVLPNESMASILKSFDTKANLNFAMGISFKETQLYQQLRASVEYLELHSAQNRARLQRFGDAIAEKLLSIYKKESKDVAFISFLEEIKEYFSEKREIAIYEEEMHSFKKLLPFMENMPVKSLLNLFMQRIASRSIDDIRGGKITVLGVLETRSVAFDTAIIIDFDDSNVPKRSDKDMFLNTQIREVATLPTMSDRENLQKHYYEMLINASKEVAISYVSSSVSSSSKFLKQLDIKEKNLHSELEYASLLFEKVHHTSQHFEDFTLPYTFKGKKLSATKLKTFLTCKRKFYYKYIEHLQNHRIPQDIPQEYEIGNSVHAALKELYTYKDSYTNPQELQKDLEKFLDDTSQESELEKYLISLQKKRLKPFATQEVARFKDGWRVAYVEKQLSIPYHGLILEGQIDRVDKRKNEIEVLDYKTGSYTLYKSEKSVHDATDFQLEFYYLLTQGLGNVIGCGFYDLKESKIVPESFFDIKLASLYSHIEDLLHVEEIETKRCEDIKACLYCEYKILCHR